MRGCSAAICCGAEHIVRVENLLSLTQVDVRWGLNDCLSSFLECDLIWHAANLQECTLENWRFVLVWCFRRNVILIFNILCLYLIAFKLLAHRLRGFRKLPHEEKQQRLLLGETFGDWPNSETLTALTPAAASSMMEKYDLLPELASRSHYIPPYLSNSHFWMTRVVEVQRVNFFLVFLCTK